ncbi:MAG: type II secretion system F family protein [Pacificimonas sp.]
MTAFLYRAVDASGAAKSGVIEAASPTGARAALRAQTLLPLLVTEANETARSRGGFDLGRIRLFRRGAMNARALALVTRQLSTLVANDVRVEEALRTVARQAERPQVRALLLNLRAAILDGRSFASALGDHPAAFPEYYRASIAAGEQSGQLGSVLLSLADFVEARQENRQKVQLALLYPALLALVSLAIITLLLIYVVPDIVRVFVNRGTELPFLTRALILLSDGMSTFGVFAAILAGAGALFWKRWLKLPANRLSWHHILATSRLTAGFSRQVNAAQFAGTLATLVEAGVPLTDALATASAVTPNLYIRQSIEAAATQVREGASLSVAAERADVFPPMLVAMIGSGEASGKLGASLARAAADQQRELAAKVAAIVALVEPGVLLLMGGFVLLMVLAILLPIIGLNDMAAL